MRHLVLWILAAAVLVVTGVRAIRAQAVCSASQSSAAFVQQQAEELGRLRVAASVLAVPSRSDGGLPGRINQSLTQSGLTASALQSLSPETQSSDKGLVRQHAVLTLSGITLPQVGKFLNTWRTREPAWVISGLDLSPSGTGTPGADLPLRAVITLDAIFKEQPHLTSAPGTGATR